MTERSNKKKYPLCAAALALAVLLAGCAPAEGAAVATAQPTAEPTEAPTPTPEPEMNPLTGEQGDYTNQRPVAVSIRTGDGSTPQWGIAAADVLIEGVTEGKTAGLTAVFASVDSVEKAGPVAPGRDLPLQLVLPLNAVPVHINKSVYASNLLNVLQYQDLDGYHAGTAGFAFDEDRANSGYREENCWYTTKDLINTGLATYNTDTAGANMPLFHFVQRKDPEQQNAKSLYITFSNKDTEELVYSPEVGLYLKNNADGSPMMDAGNNEQAAFTNVFVLYASSGVKDDGVTRQYDLTGGTGIYLMRAESPGPSVDKLTPHLRQTAMILYGIYILLTALCIGCLLLGGMPVFDSFCIAFGTAGTGGFAIKNSSMGGYSYFLQTVVTVFMFLFGVNFSLYYMLLLRKFKAVFKNEELRLYFGIAASSIILIAINISRMYNTVYESVHHAAFQVVSIMTTTGYGTVDFEQWPAFSKAILLSLMFIGASAGSTGGGLKVSRVLLLMKSIRRTIRKALHPRRVQPVYMDGRAVSEEVCDNVNAYLAIYCVILVLSFAIISVDGFSIGTNFSAVASCFNNIGPGFELVGATQNFSIYSDLSKIILSLDMLLGRLEIFPLLLLLSPDTWSRRR